MLHAHPNQMPPPPPGTGRHILCALGKQTTTGPNNFCRKEENGNCWKKTNQARWRLKQATPEQANTSPPKGFITGRVKISPALMPGVPHCFHTPLFSGVSTKVRLLRHCWKVPYGGAHQEFQNTDACRAFLKKIPTHAGLFLSLSFLSPQNTHPGWGFLKLLLPPCLTIKPAPSYPPTESLCWAAGRKGGTHTGN